MIVVGNAKEINEFWNSLPEEPRTDAAQEAVIEDEQFMERMTLDVPAVFDEISEEINDLESSVRNAKANILHGAKFDGRDAARRVHEELYKKLVKRIRMARAVYAKTTRAAPSKGLSF